MKYPKSKRIIDKNGYLKYCRDNPYCEICGYFGTPAHHIIFKSHGGSDLPENLITLCADHHAKAHGIASMYWKPVFLQIKGIKNA